MDDQRTCAHCGKTFSPRFFLAIKLGTKRLERCPHCHRMTDVYARPEIAAEPRREIAMSEDEILRRRIEESKEERE